VKDAIYSMSLYKALDPNDFQPILFTFYLAETTIVLISNTDEPQIMVEFRPISLCNVLQTYFKGFGSKNYALIREIYWSSLKQLYSKQRYC